MSHYKALYKHGYVSLYSASAPVSWMNDSWLALRGSSVESFPFRMSLIVNRDSRKVVLSDFALCACECEFELH